MDLRRLHTPDVDAPQAEAGKAPSGALKLTQRAAVGTNVDPGPNSLSVSTICGVHFTLQQSDCTTFLPALFQQQL